MADAVVNRVEYPNFAGMLFQKGRSDTPFSTLIGSNPMTTNSAEFPVGVFYDAPTGEQPAISEQASQTAPNATAVSRTQQRNVTQIHQYKLAVTYAKQSDMGTLQGINAAGQVANPADELSFQIAQKMKKASVDIEYSFINGVYSNAGVSDKAAANKTRGILNAVTTNSIDVGSKTDDTVTSKALTYWKVAEAMASIYDAGGDTSNLCLGASTAAILQLNKDASENDYLQDVVTIAGINLKSVVTPFGSIILVPMYTLNDKASVGYNSAIIFDSSIMHPVFQPVPGKGNFFLEQLAKTGAADVYQLYGQIGLDYGDEAYSAKLNYISNDMPTGTL